MIETKRYHSFFNSEDPQRWGRSEMPEQYRLTQNWLLKIAGAAASDFVILELGCGLGSLKDVHPNYVGLEFSLPALRHFPPTARCINGDMQCLPFRRDSVDFMFSWAALEHVPYPEQVLAEIERVLKPGGSVLLAPAWNCRSWASKGLPIRPYRELSWPERLSKLSIPIRNNLIWRAMFTLPARLYRELRFYFLRQSLPFDYKRLSPNLDEYIYTDCDAFTSMDSHAAILYYLSRGWRVMSHPTFIRRLLAKHEPVVVQKPSPTRRI